MSQIAKHDLSAALNDIYADVLNDKEERNALFRRGLMNLACLPATPAPIKGKEFSEGCMGFRKQSYGIQLAVACGKAMVRYLDLKKFITMVEQMDDPQTATIMLQNSTDSDDSRGAKGQILGRINPKASAITIIQGVTGRIIRGPSDIALYDSYFINRKDLTSFYLASKAQISTADTLETMIAAFDGWKAFDVPLDPLKPYGQDL